MLNTITAFQSEKSDGVNTVHGAAASNSVIGTPNGTTPKVRANAGTYKIIKCKSTDEAIANKDRLQINAIWMQRGVKDEEAAARARAAGLGVVMDTCPKIEYPKLRPRI